MLLTRRYFGLRCVRFRQLSGTRYQWTVYLITLLHLLVSALYISLFRYLSICAISFCYQTERRLFCSQLQNVFASPRINQLFAPKAHKSPYDELHNKNNNNRKGKHWIGQHKTSAQRMKSTQSNLRRGRDKGDKKRKEPERGGGMGNGKRAKSRANCGIAL